MTSRGLEKTLDPKARAPEPEMRTTAIPPAPGAVEMAQIVAPSTASRRVEFMARIWPKFAAHSQTKATHSPQNNTHRT